jgi:hypothetical protein
MENAPHLHLMINHLPVFASLLALPLLLLALLKVEAAGLTLAACLLMVASAVGGGGSMVTGKGAQSEVGQLPGVTRDLLDAHEERAERAAWLAAFAGLVALGVGAAGLRGKKPTMASLVFLLLLDGATALLMGGVGQSGGVIRHTEVR